MKHQFIYLALVVSLLTACERVIDIDLNEADSKIVIEANIHNGDDANIVRITKTGSFLVADTVVMVTGAKITLEDGISTYPFFEIEDGIYELDKLGRLFPTTYTLKVEVDGEIYEASSTMHSAVELKYLSSKFEKETVFQNEGYSVSFGFKDPVDEVNYYRVKYYLNGHLQNNREDYFLRKDELFNGNLVQMQIYTTRFIKGDTVDVELMSIDKNTYDYFSTLINVMMQAGIESAAPANPKGNFSNGALGYFSAYSSDMAGIVVKDSQITD